MIASHSHMAPHELSHYPDSDFAVNVTEHSLPAGQQPMLNILEKGDHYRIELAVPGLQREDFSVQIKDNILLIEHQATRETRKAHYFVHQFDYNGFRQEILLPPQIDIDFVRAEYKAGVLSIYLNKSHNPIRYETARIIVY